MQATKDQPVATTEALVLRACQRDADAFAALIGRYERTALSVAYSVLNNADAAGDVVQDAFLRAWQRLGDLKEPARFATWLCGITRNLAIDQHRRGKFMKFSINAESSVAHAVSDDRWGGADPLDEIERRERHAQVDAALQSLDDITRPAMVLRYFDDLSSKEIGEVLGLSPAAVDMRLSRGRQQLKQMLSAELSRAGVP